MSESPQRRAWRLTEPLDAGVLTDAGRELRAGLEATTDPRAEPASAAIGPDRCRRLAELTRPMSIAVVTAGTPAPDPGAWS